MRRAKIHHYVILCLSSLRDIINLFTFFAQSAHAMFTDRLGPPAETLTLFCAILDPRAHVSPRQRVSK